MTTGRMHHLRTFRKLACHTTEGRERQEKQRREYKERKAKR